MKSADWTVRFLVGCSAIALSAGPAHAAQSVSPAAPDPEPAASAMQDEHIQEGEVIVTAQRQSQAAQSVPIAISAFSGAALQRQQINSSQDLQLTVPNVTFTKTNFNSSSFTIRGIGDLCTGQTCDAATGIHINDMPLVSSRLFETEYFDLARIEVLRGPQGTLFGRNATSGVVNVITAKPDLSRFSAAADAEYGNYNAARARGMINVPLSETLGVRLAGYYNRRDGYTYNIGTDSRIDGRDLYAVRGSLRWQPSSRTTVDLMAYYFRENDDRSRLQKQGCHRDPTGILGCSPDRLGNEVVNNNATLSGILTSREFFGIAVSPAFASLGLGSIYGPDSLSGATNPAGPRTVNLDYLPRYFADEEIYQAKIQQDIGDSLSVNVTGGYTRNQTYSRTDFNLAIENSLLNNPGLVALQGFAASPTLGRFFAPLARTLIPNGPGGGVCQSDTDAGSVGIYGGSSAGCFNNSLSFDYTRQAYKQYAAEAHIDSKFDGPFNFLLGASYVHGKSYGVVYDVLSFGLDYASGVLGAAAAAGGATGGVPVFRPSPYFRSNTRLATLSSYGIFGEAYFEATDRLKLTLGARYNNDRKFLRGRSTLFSDGTSTEFTGGAAVFAPYGATDISQALNYATSDFDKGVAGVQEFQERRVKFGRFTGRAVIDYQVTPANLLYASYSRGYKSGGINPPVSVGNVPVGFAPEAVDAFELGSKNRFGALQLNLTGFFYKYSKLQLARSIARTVINDNVDADIYGAEAEAIITPIRDLQVNLNASYLHTRITSDSAFINPRDVSGGRSDTVIIKDLTNAANCAVTASNGTAASANGFVNAINGGIGLQPTTPLAGTNTTGAFSICSVLNARASTAGASFGGIAVSSGVPVSIRGNALPQAPVAKVSAGVQYTYRTGGVSIVPRVDISYTGDQFGTVFNGNIARIPGYEIINAQIQVNGPGDRWFVRGFIQNVGDNNAVTGQYIADQSSGLYTNLFTLEPRRYGIGAGFRF